MFPSPDSDSVAQSRHTFAQTEPITKEELYRSRALLSLVLAIAWQTKASDHESFMARFSDRVRSLSLSQDLLMQNGWRGGDLEELIRIQLMPFKAGSRIRFQGEALKLSAAAIQNLGLALHELAVNAHQYGALSAMGGEVRIAWLVSQGRFLMSWRERNGPAVSGPGHRGFGSEVLSWMLEMNLDAKVALDFPGPGLQWRLNCPLAAIAVQD
jgi:two-component sensor histidine kinase